MLHWNCTVLAMCVGNNVFLMWCFHVNLLVLPGKRIIEMLCTLKTCHAETIYILFWSKEVLYWIAYFTSIYSTPLFHPLKCPTLYIKGTLWCRFPCYILLYGVLNYCLILVILKFKVRRVATGTFGKARIVWQCPLIWWLPKCIFCMWPANTSSYMYHLIRPSYRTLDLV